MNKSIEVFTDGASRGNPGLGSCGYIIFDESNNKHSYCKCYDNVTNNRMEILAIYEALSYCLKMNWCNRTINLYSDSNWAIGAGFKNWNISVNKDYVDKVRLLKIKFLKLNIHKVNGHSNCEGNNMIDSLLNKEMDNYKETNL